MSGLSVCVAHVFEAEGDDQADQWEQDCEDIVSPASVFLLKMTHAATIMAIPKINPISDAPSIVLGFRGL